MPLIRRTTTRIVSRRRAGALAALAGLIATALVLAAPAPAAQAAASDQVTLLGHGYGHGRGLGQWGSQGYATNAGWSASQILDHFYSNTAAAGVDPSTLIDVRLVSLDGRDLRITSGVRFYVAGVEVDAGRTATLSWLGNGQVKVVISSTPCGTDSAWTYTGRASDWVFPIGVSDAGNDLNLMLTVCNADGGGGNVSYRGILKLVNDGANRTVNEATIEQYLRGVVPRESPASWSQAALQAQAVAARSYALAENRYPYAKTCDTTACQVYAGAGRNGQLLEDSRTNTAIASTAGGIRTLDGSVARTEFSSSTGGYTAGGTFPAVPDEGDSISPYHDWSTTLTGGQLQAAYPAIGTFLSINITSRDGRGDWGGRVLSLTVNGTSGSVTRTGFQFQSDWGLRSNWFTVGAQPQYRNWYLRNSATPGSPQLSAIYGGPTDQPVVGDWDANGTDTIGAYANGTWALRNSVSNGSPNSLFAYGYAGTTAVVGDWDGGGTGKGDGIGVFDRGTWYLRNTVGPGPAEAAFPYGGPNDVPVVGDWNGDGFDTVGVYAGGTFYLRNSNGSGPPDLSATYGPPGSRPVVGDWNADGRTDIGVYAAGGWYLRYNLAGRSLAGPPDITVGYGDATYLPVTGDWDGNGTDTIGVVVTA